VTRPRVLLCDDAPGFRVLVQTVLEDAGMEIAAEAGSWDEAERLAAAGPYDAVLLDLWLPVFDHAAVARVRAACPGAVLAVISSLGQAQVAELVEGIDGIDLVLSKRDSPETLVAALQARLGA
jgi:CheY-like chemotaxis protein